MKRTTLILCILSVSLLFGACKHRKKHCCGAKAPLHAYPTAPAQYGYTK
ncbi:MAG: hypothetical protein P1U85_02060 [Verrucomicrobiales bacterium]|nr:hypothetical protein [Verrucomicrobiales bacterium]